MTTTWDDLLDDYERRIEAISLALATDTQVPTHAFIPPQSSIADPTPQQLQRFRALQAKAAIAAGSLLEKLEATRGEAEHSRKATVAHRAYMVADSLA